MWKLSLHNASTMWNKKYLHFNFHSQFTLSLAYISNLTLGQSVHSVKLTISMWFHSMGEWEVRDCQQLSQTSVCDAAPVLCVYMHSCNRCIVILNCM